MQFCLQYNIYIGNTLQEMPRVRMNSQTCRYSIVVFSALFVIVLTYLVVLFPLCYVVPPVFFELGHF
jgi:hypothetical protein